MRATQMRAAPMRPGVRRGGERTWGRGSALRGADEGFASFPSPEESSATETSSPCPLQLSAAR